MLWVLGAWSVTAVIWWVTGVGISYGVVVASVALGALNRPPVTARRALEFLAFAVSVAVVGALTLGRAKIGLSVHDRIGQVGGIAVAALVLIVSARVHRRRERAGRA